MTTVEAVFPRTHDGLDVLVNLDEFEAVSYYLTGIEYIIKYLIRHRTKLERDGSPVPSRIEAMLTAFGSFLCSPSWKTQKSRQGVVLWALRYSQLPLSIKQMTLEAQIPDILGKGLLLALKEAVVVLERGYLAPSAGVEEVAMRGARSALSLIQSAIRDVEPSQLAATQGTAPISSGDRESTILTRATLTIDPPFAAASLETQEWTVVRASESTIVKDDSTIKTPQATPQLYIAIPRIYITPPSIDSSWDEEEEPEATTPSLESVLDIVDPLGPFIPYLFKYFRIADIYTEFAFMDEGPVPTDQVDDMLDTPVLDPEMLRWRTGAPAPEKQRHGSPGSVMATRQDILRLPAASKWKSVRFRAYTEEIPPLCVGRRVALPIRKPPPRALPPVPPRPPGRNTEIEMDVVEQWQHRTTEEII